MRQRQTLKKAVELEGLGLHSGEMTHIRLAPAPAGHGVVFRRTDLEGAPAIPAQIENAAADAMTRQTSLQSPDRPDARVATVEHFLAALHGFEIDDCLIEMDGAEAPLFDGSALKIAKAVAEAGVEELDRPAAPITLKTPVAFSQDDVEIVATPSESLRVTFFLDYSGTMIGRQALSVEVTPERFVSDIAPARTFCLRQEIEFLREKGLIRGGSLDMALVVDGDRLVNEDTALRFEDEFVRHKILDLLGDSYLLGAPLKAHILAVKSGHATHARFMAKLREVLKSAEKRED